MGGAKWAARIVALLMLLAFALVMSHLHKQLVMLQRQQDSSHSR
jgi:hypothetical protein